MADFSADNIVKKFETPDGLITILDGVTVDLNRGQNLAVLGPSGSGKSTFLHIAGTLDLPTAGSIRLNGQDPAGLAENRLAEFRNKNIGFVFQEHHLLPQLTAIENVLIPAIASGPATSASVDRAKMLLEAVDLTDRMHQRPGTLSGGERQRVAVARSLILEPVLLLADEPTGSLDRKNAQVIGELLMKLQAAGNAILICVTHSQHLAGRFESRVELQDGKFVPVD